MKEQKSIHMMTMGVIRMEPFSGKGEPEPGMGGITGRHGPVSSGSVPFPRTGWRRALGLALGGWLLFSPVTGLSRQTLGRSGNPETAGAAARGRERREPSRRAVRRRARQTGERSPGTRNAKRITESGPEDGPGQERAERARPGGGVRLASATPPGLSGGTGRSPEVQVTSESVTHRVRLAPNGVVVVEFPLADALYAVHPGNQNIVEVDIDKDHKPNDPVVFRPGPNFDPTMRTQTAHSLQFISGLFVTLIFEPVDRIEDNDHRIILQYDIARIRGIRAEKGLATNLVRRPTSPLLEEDPKQQPLPPTQPELLPPLPPAERRKTDVPANQARTPSPGTERESAPEPPPRQAPARMPSPVNPPPPSPTSALPRTEAVPSPVTAGATPVGSPTPATQMPSAGVATDGRSPETSPAPDIRRAETERTPAPSGATGSREEPAGDYRRPLSIPSFTMLGLQLAAEERRQAQVTSATPRTAVDGENGKVLHPQLADAPRDKSRQKKSSPFPSPASDAQRGSRSGAAGGAVSEVELYRLEGKTPTHVTHSWRGAEGTDPAWSSTPRFQLVQYGGGSYGGGNPVSPGGNPGAGEGASGPTPAEREKYRLITEYYQSLGLSVAQIHALRLDLERRVQNHRKQKSTDWLSQIDVKQSRQTFSRWPAMVCFVEIIDEPDFPGLRRYVLSITVHEKAERPVYLASLDPDIFVITRNGKTIVNTERLIPLVTLSGSTDSVIRPGETAYFGIAIPRPVLSDNQILEIGFIDAEKANRPILAREFRIRRP